MSNFSNNILKSSYILFGIICLIVIIYIIRQKYYVSKKDVLPVDIIDDKEIISEQESIDNENHMGINENIIDY